MNLGFIAQDVEKVFPALVSEGPVKENGIRYKGLSYQDFGVLSVQAIKELKAEKDAEITQLQSEIKTLKARLDRLEAKK